MKECGKVYPVSDSFSAILFWENLPSFLVNFSRKKYGPQRRLCIQYKDTFVPRDRKTRRFFGRKNRWKITWNTMDFSAFFHPCFRLKKGQTYTVHTEHRFASVCGVLCDWDNVAIGASDMFYVWWTLHGTRWKFHRKLSETYLQSCTYSHFSLSSSGSHFLLV